MKPWQKALEAMRGSHEVAGADWQSHIVQACALAAIAEILGELLAHVERLDDE